MVGERRVGKRMGVVESLALLIVARWTVSLDVGERRGCARVATKDRSKGRCEIFSRCSQM